MAVYRAGKKCLRDWIVGTDDAARAIHVSLHQFRLLVEEGFFRPAARKGFYRLGCLIDGHAEAVRLGRIKAPHERPQNRAVHLAAVGQNLSAMQDMAA